MGALGNLRLSPPTNPDFRPWSTAHHNKFGLASTWGKSSTSLVQFLRGHVKTYFIQTLSVLSLDQSPQSLFSIIFWFLYSWWFGTFFIFPDIGNNYPNWPIFFRGVGQPPSSLFFPAFSVLSLQWPPFQPTSWRSRFKAADADVSDVEPRLSEAQMGRTVKSCWNNS